MITSSSKYNMAYFNIKQLEGKLAENNIATSLWRITRKKLIAALDGAIPAAPGMELSFLKDKSNEKDLNGNDLFRGLFVVSSSKVLTESEMQILLTEYLNENPNTDRTIPKQKTHNLDDSKYAPMSTNNHKIESEDLNYLADNLEKDNLVFGVIDDPNHIEVVSKIEGVDIIRNFGDFKKVYFSIPSFRRDEVLAHSVTILNQIKCKRSLMDFVSI